MVRINSQMLQMNKDKMVHVVGRVVNVDPHNGMATVETCDNGHVNVRIAPGSRLEQGGIVVEVVGRVGPDLVVEEQTSSMFEGEYSTFSTPSPVVFTSNAGLLTFFLVAMFADTAAYGKLIELTKQFPDLFE
ncbi:hypothetical protein HDU96_008559 [Phlyctochytrium bullatum]|nr:hypothetical protein HDU96_008559 [Phlyctochytrium bullatum]